MFNKLKSITPLVDLFLLAEFQDGTQKAADAKMAVVSCAGLCPGIV